MKTVIDIVCCRNIIFEIQLIFITIFNNRNVLNLLLICVVAIPVHYVKWKERPSSNKNHIKRNKLVGRENTKIKLCYRVGYFGIG